MTIARRAAARSDVDDRGVTGGSDLQEVPGNPLCGGSRRSEDLRRPPVHDDPRPRVDLRVDRGAHDRVEELEWLGPPEKVEPEELRGRAAGRDDVDAGERREIPEPGSVTEDRGGIGDLHCIRR